MIKHYQVPFEEETIEKLKEATNKEAAKDAITEAVEHYLKCKRRVRSGSS